MATVDGRLVMLNPAQQMQMGVTAFGPHSPAMRAAQEILNRHGRLQMRQQRQWVEALTGFERNNRYVLRDDGGQDLFFIRETSTCLERNCCAGACKAWSMDIYILGPAGLAGGEAAMTRFIRLERPCTCTCLCSSRPVVMVSDASTGELLGSIIEPFTCCNLRFTVRDRDETPILETDASCCQAGLLCPCICEGLSCNKVDFPVTDVGTGNPVAHIEKRWMLGDFCQCCSQEWDNYWVHFGDAANPDFKVLLLATAVFIQMRLFDRRNQSQG